MKRISIVFALLVVIIASIGVVTTPAQEAPLDLGEQSLLVVACNQVVSIAKDENLGPKACRRDKPEEVLGNRAVVHVRLYTGVYKTPFLIDVTLQKSLWSMHSLVVTK